MRKVVKNYESFADYHRSKKSSNAAYAQIQRDYDGKYSDDYNYDDVVDFRLKAINYKRY